MIFNAFDGEAKEMIFNAFEGEGEGEGDDF